MHPHGYIGRKLRQAKLQERPVIIIAAFGSSGRGRAALDLLDAGVRDRFPEYHISWAYTSGIIRKKTGQPGLHQCLAEAQSQGYRKAVVLPLQIFPGTEYHEIAETAEFFPGIRTILGETLLHRWEFAKELLTILEKDFLSAGEGLNLLALHGTPLAADPANAAYLGFDRLVRDRYENVITAALEGVPDYASVFAGLRRQRVVDRFGRLRILPLMYLAGLHVEDDVMGENQSWKTSLEELGLRVDCPTIVHGQETFYKSLGFTPQIREMFFKRIARALELIRYY